MPAAKRTLSNEKFYSRLIVYVAKKTTLWFLCTFVFAGFMWLLFQNGLSNQSWEITTIPIVLLGSILIFFPVTEEWEYKPWQSSPQQYERHFRD